MASKHEILRLGGCSDIELIPRIFSNHQHHDCLLNRLFKAQIKETIKAPHYWPLWGEFTGDDEFPLQRASNAENVSIWWRHHLHMSMSILYQPQTYVDNDITACLKCRQFHIRKTWVERTSCWPLPVVHNMEKIICHGSNCLIGCPYTETMICGNLQLIIASS